MAAEDARIYRIRAEYRRCGIYVLVGAIICFLVATTVMPLVKQFARPKADPGEMMVITGLLVAAAAVFCLILRQWRLRVDHEGIVRRRLWRWYVWPWEAFRSGKIKQDRVLRAYIWPEARWTYRKLLLDMIEDADAKEVDALIKRLWIARTGTSGSTGTFDPIEVRLAALEDARYDTPVVLSQELAGNACIPSDASSEQYSR
jgi:hypothetical protein